MTYDPQPCAASDHHRPLPVETDRHHIYPKYLCGLLGVPIIHTTVPLCGACHQAVHHVLEHLISDGEAPGHRWTTTAVGPWIAMAWHWWQSEL